jgi:hypothetical protein
MEVVGMPTTTLRIHVGQVTHRGPLTAFPVWTDAPSPPRDYFTGADASVDVAERTGTPTVDQLVVTNRGQHPVLLLAGELLEGGWQTRALTATTLVAPGQPSVQQAVCVEEGRWGGDIAHRRQARRVPFAVRARFDRPDAQQAVWDRVRDYDSVAGPSETGSLTDRLDRTASVADDLTGGLRPLVGQRGLLVGIAGRPACSGVRQRADTRSPLGRPPARGDAGRPRPTGRAHPGRTGTLVRRARRGNQARVRQTGRARPPALRR